MTVKYLKNLKKKLPSGSIVRIAEQLGLSTSYVSYVLNGKRLNERVIQLAIDLAKENNKKNEKLIKQINLLK